MAEDMKKKAEEKEEPQAPEEEQAVVAYYYLPDENPGGGGYPGVPLRDLLEHEVAAYPKWIQENLRGSHMYSADAPGKKSVKADKESEK